MPAAPCHRSKLAKKDDSVISSTTITLVDLAGTEKFGLEDQVRNRPTKPPDETAGCEVRVNTCRAEKQRCDAAACACRLKPPYETSPQVEKEVLRHVKPPCETAM